LNRDAAADGREIPASMLKLCALVLALSRFAAMAADAPAGAAGEERFLGNIRQLTLEGRRSGEGYFASDGKAMVFQSEREPGNPFYQIYFLDLESGDSHRVSPGIGKTTCSFLRPGSDEVLFASTHHDPEAVAKQKAELEFRASGKQKRYSWDYDEGMDIFVAKRDGSGLRPLTTARGYDAEGSYSPDGSLIAFCSLRDAYPAAKLSAEDRKRLETDPAYFGEIYLMNADGTNQRRLTDWPGYDGGPFFSPNGKRIIWRHFETNGAIADVYTMALDGSDRRRLTDFKAMSWAPYFHPSGKYVIFASNKLGFSNFELYMVDAEDAREPVRVTTHDGFDGLPVFSPDGAHLAWTSGRTPGGNSQIFMADWNDAAARDALDHAPVRNTSSPAEATAVPDAPRAATPAAPLEKRLRDDVAFLASEDLEGRLTGFPGARRAADFIASKFQAAGVQPVPGVGGYFQPFEFSAGAKILTNQNSLSIRAGSAGAQTLELGRDYRPLAFTANGTVEGDVVFAGYGLSMPAGAGAAYDSYSGLNVSNKIVLVMRYAPEGVDTKRRQELNHYSGLRYKALMARNRGALGLLVVTGPNSPNAGELVEFSFDTSQSGSGIIAASITAKTAEALLDSSGKSLKALQDGLDTENPHAEGGFAITNAHVRLVAALEQTRRKDQNVLGWLPPADPNAKGEVVLVGAHYDHLGRGETGSLMVKGEEGKVHAGADDNASGTATVLELAEACARERAANPQTFRRGVIFALWSGEELGLIGSAHYVEHPPVPLTNTVACINFDMVGRLRDNKVILNGIGSSSVWRKLLEKRNVAAGFNLQLLDDPFPPTDVTSFYPRGVPVLAFFTGSHEEYHRPGDLPATLNYPGMERVMKFANAVVHDLAAAPERPDYLKVAPTGGGGSRETLRAYLGTIPDYAAEVNGVKLSGVRGGSPADKAGLKSGDIIVEFGGQKIANIYDYTYALDAVKIGKVVTIAVQRAGDRVQVTATPEARK
jgi:Tol biopolymer transport system component